MRVKRISVITLITSLFVLAFSSLAMAQQIIVTPDNAAATGWFSDDTRPGGAINFVVDPTAPGNPHVGALQLTTDATTTAKAQFMHLTNTPLSAVNELSYSTKQNSASFVGGDASYQLQVCLGGLVAPTPENPSGCIGFTTLVFEPYQNGVVTPGVWQNWDVDAGQFWSSRSYSNGTCTVVAGGGGAPFYTLAGLQSSCPGAVAVKFGVNIGSNNPAYNVETDLVSFNGTVYNFEPYVVANDKEQCKNGGWQAYRRVDGSPFKNQGDCVQYTNTGK
jgi:hypothetical protein